MIEPIMFIGIGFLVAGLLVIGVIPMVHARAVRLTQRRLEAMTPLSMAEIQADKDQLRAEFAMSTRRLEMSVDQMKAKTTTQLAEIGKKSEAVSRLKLELGEKAAGLLAAEAKGNSLVEELEATRNELAARTEELAERERTLAETSAELAKFTTQYHETSLTADSLRVELAALAAQGQLLRGQVDGYEKEIREHKDRIETQTANAETVNRQLGEERTRTENYGTRIAEFEHQLVVQTTEAEILGRRVQELLARLDEHERMAADRDFATEQARSQAAAAQRIEADVRTELATQKSQHEAAAQVQKTQHETTLLTITNEKTQAEEQLRLVQQERDQAREELDKAKREAEAAWAAERMESAVMRERINDVAAEVARLTATLEGPSSPIEAILSGEGGPAREGNGRMLMSENGANGGAQKGSLADRIRALQTRRAAVSQAN
jgi:chromosome segregation ATPase